MKKYLESFLIFVFVISGWVLFASVVTYVFGFDLFIRVADNLAGFVMGTVLIVGLFVAIGVAARLIKSRLTNYH